MHREEDEQEMYRILDIYTEQLRKVDRYLVKAIKATKEITDE